MIVLLIHSFAMTSIPAKIVSQKNICIPISPTITVTMLLNSPRIGESAAKDTEKKYSAPMIIIRMPSLFLSSTKVLLFLATFFFLLATLKLLVGKRPFTTYSHL